MDTSMAKRKENYTNEAVGMLIEEVGLGKEIIFSSSIKQISNQKKKEKWTEITDKLNTICDTQRSTDEVRKKWMDLASRTKAKEMKRRKQIQEGSDQPLKALTEDELSVLALIGKPSVSGVDGWIDTSQVNSVKLESSPDDYAEYVPTVCGSSASMLPTEYPTMPCSPIRKTSAHSCKQEADYTFYPNDRDGSLVSAKESDYMSIEQERLNIDRQRLALQTQTLEIEKERLSVEYQKLAVLKEISQKIDEGFKNNYKITENHDCSGTDEQINSE